MADIEEHQKQAENIVATQEKILSKAGIQLPVATQLPEEIAALKVKGN